MIPYHLARRLLAHLPFGVDIDGKEKRNVLAVMDALCTIPTSDHQVEVLGVRLDLDPEQSAERLLLYVPENVVRHFVQSPLYTIIRRIFQHRSGVFLDIGANLGLYSLLARHHGADAVLFEPEPIHFDFLQRNAAPFGEVLPLALSDRCGTATFHVGDQQHTGASSLCEGDGDDTIYRDAVEVEVSTFDAFAQDHALDLDRIALIKLDVEGHEAATLRGMADYLARPDAAPLWCEVRGPESGRGGDSYREALALLEPLGYRAFVVDRTRARVFEPERDVRQVFDLLFAVPDRHAHVVVA